MYTECNLISEHLKFSLPLNAFEPSPHHNHNMISSPILKYKHTIPRKASAVLALVKAKVPYSKIKAQEHVGKSSIARIKARALENPDNPTAARARTGRPSALSEWDKRALVRDAVYDRECTVQSLAKNYGCSNNTVLKTLDEKDYHKRVARYKPFLTSKQKKARLAFAKAHLRWTEKDWEQVMFSDECNIELGLDSRIVRVWRRPDEEFSDACIKPTFKSGRTSVGIWSYIMGKEIGPVVFLDGRMNAVKYKDAVLEEVVGHAYVGLGKGRRGSTICMMGHRVTGPN